MTSINDFLDMTQGGEANVKLPPNNPEPAVEPALLGGSSPSPAPAAAAVTPPAVTTTPAVAPSPATGSAANPSSPPTTESTVPQPPKRTRKAKAKHTPETSPVPALRPDEPLKTVEGGIVNPPGTQTVITTATAPATQSVAQAQTVTTQGPQAAAPPVAAAFSTAAPATAVAPAATPPSATSGVKYMDQPHVDESTTSILEADVPADLVDEESPTVSAADPLMQQIADAAAGRGDAFSAVPAANKAVEPPPSQPLPSTTFRGDEVLARSQRLLMEIDGLVLRKKRECAITVLENASCYDPDQGTVVNREHFDPSYPHHYAVYLIRWRPDLLVQRTPQDLCEYGVALSGLQAWVQSQENEFAARAKAIGEEYDRVIFEKRKHVSGGTQQEKEEKILSAEPQMWQMYCEYRKSQALAKVLEKMGERFAQLENSIKRITDLQKDQYLREMNRGGRV